MCGTIVHTQAKEFITKTGTRATIRTGQYALKIGDPRQETDYGQLLHWTTGKDLVGGGQELLERHSETVEAPIEVLKETLDSKKARYGLSPRQSRY